MVQPIGMERDEVVDWFARNFGPYVFDGPPDPAILADLDGAEILLAHLASEPYEESAWLVWRKGGVVYEAHGSHCSCFGFEDQWSPEETSIEAILTRKYVAPVWGIGMDEIRAILGGE